jgi:asparagine synthase (glutamine-hydrolysing)
MCGICGIVGFKKEPIRQERLQSMTDAIAHRGPDDQGHYFSGDRAVALGHRRLSIIDLSEKGHQPMSIGSGRYWIVFNGEIYDFQETRDKLMREGYRFATETDTEVVLYLYEKYDINCVDYLRGMFALAIWDDDKKTFFAARDRLGKKPFFYTICDGQLVFASELKSITAQLADKFEIDPKALDQYLAFGYIPAPLTIYRGVFKLPPGHRMQLSAQGIKIDRYWDLNFDVQPATNEAALTDQVEKILRDSVRLRLVSDVPLGALLSGGVDSSVVVALMAQEGGRPPKTFSIGFEEDEYSELTHARKVAKHVGAEHHEQILRPDVIELLTGLVEQFDEPFADSSMIPTYLVSKHARQHITVALSGDGGDEVFGGYPRYLYETLTNKMLRVPGARVAAEAASAVWPDHWRGKVALSKMKYPEGRRYAEQMSFFDSDARKLMHRPSATPEQTSGASEFIQSHFLPDQTTRNWTPLGRLQYLDTIVGYLPGDILTKVDIASMRVSLEMRSPLLDHRLAEFMSHVPAHYKIRGRVTKYLLKKIGERLLPTAVLYRPKRGFSLPLPAWFRGDLRGYVESMLRAPDAKIYGLINKEAVTSILDDHIRRGLDRTQMIFSLLCLEIWLRKNGAATENHTEANSLTASSAFS